MPIEGTRAAGTASKTRAAEETAASAQSRPSEVGANSGAPTPAQIPAVQAGDVYVQRLSAPAPRSSARLDGAADRVRLAISAKDAALNLDGATVQLHPSAEPRGALRLQDLLRAPAERRTELLRRYNDFVGSLLAAPPTSELDLARHSISLSHGSFKVSAAKHVVTVACADPERPIQKLRIDLSTPGAPVLELEPKQRTERSAAMAFLLEMFAGLLARPSLPASRATLGKSTLDPDWGRLFALLLGPGGALNAQSSLSIRAEQAFRSPKLIAWDFNGTVGDGEGSFRPDMRGVTDNLNRMGALSVITTTIDPEPVETLLEKADIRFNGYFGHREVRSYPANKRYGGVAEMYGLDAESARHRLCVIGDSATDVPSDLPGVLFVHSDDRTPAEVIQLLLHELDARGDGSFAEGLAASLPAPLSERPQPLSIGPVRCDVLLVDGGPRGASNPVPVITNVRVELSTPELVARLSSPPPREALAERALHDLGYRYVEGLLPEARLPSVLRALGALPDRAAAVAAGTTRIGARDTLVEAARYGSSQLELDTAFMSARELLAHADRLGSVGDSLACQGLMDFAAQFPVVNEKARAMAMASLEADARALRALLQAPSAGSADTKGPSTAQATTEAAFFARRGPRQVLARYADDPAGGGPEDRAQVLKALKAALRAPDPALAPILERMATALDPSLAQSRAATEALYVERAAQAPVFRSLALQALGQAPAREALWADARQALAELAAGRS